jgi:hypothetical protein
LFRLTQLKRKPFNTSGLKTCGLVLLALATPGGPVVRAETARALEAVRAVGPEGQGNAEASAAWKELGNGNTTNLVPILEAMDAANDYALNWLRSAFESVANRALDKGGKLPFPELGKYLLDTRHHPKGRYLVFELLSRQDPATASRLLAGMLNDPSMDIRREAVQRLLTQAEETWASSNRAGAAILFQQALHSARDAKQIEAIAKQLKGLKQPVDLLAHFGFLTDWKIIGPFDNTGRRGFDTVFPPEQKLDFDAEYDGKKGKVRWQDFVTKHHYGMVDMNLTYGSIKEVTAYALADFVSPDVRDVELRLGGKNSWKVWLNGKLLFGRDEYHTSAEIDQYVMPARLQAGQNQILVKVCQNEEIEEWTVQWEFQLRVTDSLGTPILSARTPNPSL